MISQEDLEKAVMHPLQLQVAELNICADCHKKTLEEKYRHESMKFMQCTYCKSIFVLEAND